MPDPIGMAPEPTVTPGQRELQLMRASGMHSDQMQQETQNEINLQHAAGMKEPDVQKYWGISTPKSATATDLTHGNIMTALQSGWDQFNAAVKPHVLEALKQASDANTILATPSDPDHTPDPIQSAMAIGQAALGYATAAWTMTVAIPQGAIDEGPGAQLSRIPLPSINGSGTHLAPTALGDAVSTEVQAAMMGGWKTPAGMSAAARQSALTAYMKGEIPDPQRYAASIVGDSNVTPAMRSVVPSNADYQQAATRLLAMPDKPPSPNVARRVMSNMQRIWAETGLHPDEQLALAQAHPELRQELLEQNVHGDPVAPGYNGVRRPEPKPLVPPPAAGSGDFAGVPKGAPAPAPPVTTAPLKAPPVGPTFFGSPDEAMSMFRSLEGSADSAISRPQGAGHGGAMGRFQIMPQTAAGYGYDPTRLLDPEYNTMVARHIITDLYMKYHGNREAMEIAYNSTPKRAAEYLSKGPGTRLEAIVDKGVRGGIRYVTVNATKDESFLMPETQRYLANGRRKAGQVETGEPVGPDDYTPPPHAEVPADVDVRNAEAEGDTDAAAAAKERAQAQRDEVAKADEEQGETVSDSSVGATLTWKRATDDQLLDEIGATIGVQDDTPVRGMSMYDRAVNAIMSRLQPAKVVDDLAKKTITGYNPEKEFSLLDAFRQAAHSDDRAKVAMGFNYAGVERGGVVVRDGDRAVSVTPDSATARGAIQQAIRDGGDPDGFMKWMAARRAIELEKNGKKQPFNILAAQEIMQRQSLAAKYEKAAAMWDEFTKGARDYAQASGRYSADQVAGMEATDMSKWLSFERVAGRPSGVTGRGFKVGSPVKGMKGSEDGMVGDLLGNSLDNVRAMFRAADNNYAVGKLVSMVEKRVLTVDAGEPPATGVTRLYRIEGGNRSAKLRPVQAANRWFTDTPAHLGFYADSAGEKASVKYIDVPTSDLEKYRVSGPAGDEVIANGQTPKDFSKLHNEEFFVSRDLADARLTAKTTNVLKSPELAALLGVRKVRMGAAADLDAVDKEMKAFGIPEEQWDAARPVVETLMSEREKLADNEFAFYRDGQKEVWQAGWPELTDMIKGSDPVQVGAIVKVFQSIAHGVQGAVTALPDFAAKMFASHQLVQFMTSPLHPFPFATGIEGLAKLTGPDLARTTGLHGLAEQMGMKGLLEDVMANGGLGSSLRTLDSDSHYDMMTRVLGETGWFDRVRNDVSQFKQEKTLAAAKQVGMTSVLTPFRMARAIGERLDIGNRMGLSEAGQRAGFDPLKAGSHAAEYGIDYTNRGASAAVNWWSSMVPFMRAGLLYSEQGMKAIERNPAAYAASAAIAVSLPKMILYGLNMLQDEIPAGQPGHLEENDKYRNQPVWERLYYFITPSINGQRFKLRMPDFAAYVFGVGPEAAMMAMHEHNPAGFKDLFTTFLHDFVPPVTPPAVQAPLEVAGNMNLETWQPLVPTASTGVAGELRYTADASGPAKALSKLLGPAAPTLGIGHIPILAGVDHVVQSWADGPGQMVLNALGAPHGRPGQPMDVARLPFVSSFLLTHQEGGRALSDFYDEKARFDDWAKAKGELRSETRRGDQGSAVGDYGSEAMRYASADGKIEQASIAISRMRDALYGIDANKTMTDGDKVNKTNQILNQYMIPKALAYTAAMRKAMQ